LARALFTAEGEDVEVCRKIADPELMAAVVEEDGQGIHVKSSQIWIGIRGGLISTLIQVLNSFHESDKSWDRKLPIRA
jgi:hypothetical protein